MAQSPRRVRKYTREEANETLPEVRERLLRLRDAFALIAGHNAKIKSIAQANGGENEPEEWLRAGAVYREELQWLDDAGILLRDMEQGLIDFPSERDGVPILLCWRLGEASVDYWHDPESGFQGRQPLD